MDIDVSVITPTFRRERELREAVRSTLAQRGVRLEVLVLDDSPEGSARDAVLGLADTRVRYIPCDRPSGGRPGVVRNRGADLARGRYLHFLDDDDLLFGGALGALVAALELRPAAAFACGTVEPFGDDPVELARERAYFARAAAVLRRARDSRRLQAALLFGPSPLPTSVAVIRRNAFLALGGFDPEIALCEDVELYARAARRYGWTFVDRPVLRYRTGAASLMEETRGGASLDSVYRRIHERYRHDRGALDFYALKLASRAEGMLR